MVIGSFFSAESDCVLKINVKRTLNSLLRDDTTPIVACMCLVPHPHDNMVDVEGSTPHPEKRKEKGNACLFRMPYLVSVVLALA